MKTTHICEKCYQHFQAYISQHRRFCSSHCSATTHGSTRTSEYQIYKGAKKRCNNPRRKEFLSYGGRGIKFLFASFEEFMAEVGERPTPDHTLERIDNNGHYEKGNVKWATRHEQTQNRRPRKENVKKSTFKKTL